MDNEIKNIKVSLLDNPGYDSRIGLNNDEYKDLYESVRQNGILQPLLVRPRANRFEVIAGGRRLRVARELKLESLPCLVKSANDYDTTVFRLEENITRAQLNPVEEAKHIAGALTDLKIDVDEFAKRIGKTPDWINSRLAVATMPEYMQGILMQKQLPLGVALALNEITDEQVKKDWTMSALETGMTILGARNALREFQKLEQRRADTPEDTEPAPIPTEPPVAYVSCVRCGTTRPMQQTKFVRVCNPVCPVDEQG